MGVQGLTSFLERNQRIYRDVQFSNSRVVIDGCNLNYQLYFSSGLDQNHGGEYTDFKSLIERFVSALRTCGISPYVILDGGSDVSNKKHETSVKRSEDRIQRGHHAAVSSKTKDILPKLADLVFQQTLAQLKVPVAQCFEESDQEIAALAFEWRCPVLSNDSDFYIFDLPGGILPISHFQWEQVDQSSSQRYISCKRFNASSFCIFFGIESRLLPTFAALAGNDYVNLREIQWTQFVPEGSESPGRLDGLLRWLREFQEPQDALEAALGLMGHLNHIKEDILSWLHQGMEGYQLCPSILSRFFLQRVPPEFSALKQEFQFIPHWMLLSLTQARLTPVVLDVMRLHTMKGLGLGVEPEHLPSSNLTSRPVRQVLYGLLLGPESGLEVDEIDRQGLQLTSIPVQLAFSRTSRRFRLASLHQEELSDRLQVLLETLKVTPDSLSLLPPQLRLPLAVTWFWMHNAQPAPDLSLLKALLLGISTGTQPRPRTDLFHLDLDVAYLLTQWQACLKASIWLNQLLGFPLPEPEVAWLYNGTLVHQLVHRMKTGGKLKNLLKSDRTTVTRYRTMLSILHWLRAQLPLEAPQNQHQATTRQRQQRALEGQTTDLKQLFHQDEEIENEERIAIRVNEELNKEEQMVVRTRYRTKERSNKSKKPELARKEECRGWSLL